MSDIVPKDGEKLKRYRVITHEKTYRKNKKGYIRAKWITADISGLYKKYEDAERWGERQSKPYNVQTVWITKEGGE